MSELFKSFGKLRYSPKMNSLHKSEVWWLVMDCDPELGRYYRHLCSIHNYGLLKLGVPSWKTHVTIIRNEEPKDEYKHLWHKYEGIKVEFIYNSTVCDNAAYYWLNVECPYLDEIRAELGLFDAPEFPYHITIGN